MFENNLPYTILKSNYTACNEIQFHLQNDVWNLPEK